LFGRFGFCICGYHAVCHVKKYVVLWKHIEHMGEADRGRMNAVCDGIPGEMGLARDEIELVRRMGNGECTGIKA
jgi:hypothetical protein